MPARIPVTTATRTVVATTALLGLATGLIACSASRGGTAADGLTITATDTRCGVSTASLGSGRHTFSVTNSGAQVTEVYVYGAGDRIVGEVENIGPGITRSLTVDLPTGRFEVACKPGQRGDGIRTALTVSGSAASSATPSAAAQGLAAAVTDYRRYVEQQAAGLRAATAAFVTAVRSGDLARAKALYAPARLHWERIEPVAETFGDLDPRIDMRADDVTDGAHFTGFHRLERDLWQRRDVTADGAVADRLLADVNELVARVPSADITALTMANGAKALLDEVAKSKVTGEEERYSRVDLVDFLGNVEGSKQAFLALRPVLADHTADRDAELVSVLDTRFDALLALLARHRSTSAAVPGSGFVAYDDLSTADVRALAVAVDDLSEPLGRLTAAVAAL